MAHITKEFLEQALGAEIGSFEVTPGSNVGDNYSSILYSIDVSLTSEASREKFQNRDKLFLLLKCFPLNPARQDFLSAANVFNREMKVYDTVAPELTRFQEHHKQKILHKPPFPEFFFGKAVDYSSLKEGESRRCEDPLENCILMADIRKDGGFRLANRLKGFDVEHCRLVIEAQAKLHAIGWAYKVLTETPSLIAKWPFLENKAMQEAGPEMVAMMTAQNVKLIKDVIEDLDDVSEELKGEYMKSLDRFEALNFHIISLYFGNVESDAHSKDSVLRIPRPSVPTEEPWLVVTHGDSWLNNMLFKYDDDGKPEEVILVDLQMTAEGDPFTDLAYNFFTSTEADLRKEHLPELLQLYTDTFLRVCADFDIDPLPGFCLGEVQRRFERASLFGFSMASLCLPIFLRDAKDMQDPEEMKGDDMKAMFDQFTNMGHGMRSNSLYSNRVKGLVSELYANGIL